MGGLKLGAIAALIVLVAGLLGGCTTWRSVEGPGAGARLPLEEHPALSSDGGDAFVVLYSGDGGAAGGNRAIARALAARGTPTVAVDSLAYFWTGRRAEAAAKDLAALVEHYAGAWGRPKVVLAGYSFGGSALPGIAARLPATVRTRVRAVVLVAPRDYVEMTLRPHSWFNIRPRRAKAMAPDIAALGAVRVVCVAGEQDELAACPRLPAGLVEAKSLKGGHKFAGDFGAVAAIIAGEAAPAQAAVSAPPSP